MKRYDICADYSQSYAEECDDGEWVKADIAIELLDALEGLVELYPYDIETKGTGILRGFNGEVQEKVYKARNAIAKAKGEKL